MMEQRCLENGFTKSPDQEPAKESKPEPTKDPEGEENSTPEPGQVSDEPVILTDEKLIGAVAYCMAPDHPDRLTKAGIPEVKAMEEFLGTSIGAKDRNRAVELYVLAQNKG